MLPLQPEKRAGFQSVIFAKDQPQYLQLPANTNGHEVETKWQLSWAERLRCLFRGNLYLTLMTFGGPLQPIRLSVLRSRDDSTNTPQPEKAPKRPHESLGQKIKEKLSDLGKDAGNALGEAFDNR